jgi:predicted ATPase with chaperone activity
MRPVHRLTALLPEATPVEAIETTRLYRVAGLIGGPYGLGHDLAVSCPQHTISDVGLVSESQQPLCRRALCPRHGWCLLGW